MNGLKPTSSSRWGHVTFAKGLRPGVWASAPTCVGRTIVFLRKGCKKNRDLNFKSQGWKSNITNNIANTPSKVLLDQMHYLTTLLDWRTGVTANVLIRRLLTRRQGWRQDNMKSGYVQM